MKLALERAVHWLKYPWKIDPFILFFDYRKILPRSKSTSFISQLILLFVKEENNLDAGKVGKNTNL